MSFNSRLGRPSFPPCSGMPLRTPDIGFVHHFPSVTNLKCHPLLSLRHTILHPAYSLYLDILPEHSALHRLSNVAIPSIFLTPVAELSRTLGLDQHVKALLASAAIGHNGAFADFMDSVGNLSTRSSGARREKCRPGNCTKMGCEAPNVDRHVWRGRELAAVGKAQQR